MLTPKTALITNNIHRTNYANRKAEPGLVGLYDIQPGNGVGLFLQLWIRLNPTFFTHENNTQQLSRSNVMNTYSRTLFNITVPTSLLALNCTFNY